MSIFTVAPPRTALPSLLESVHARSALQRARLLPKDYDAPQQLRSEGWGNCPVPTCGYFFKSRPCSYAPAKGAVVQAFSAWYAEWSNPLRATAAGALVAGIVPADYQAFAGYHAYLFIDWCEIGGELFLVAQNSAGPLLGD